MPYTARQQRGAPSCRLLGMKVILPLLLAFGLPAADAQWQILNSHSTADLAGVYAVDNNVAWASGSKGTILHTVDGGHSWEVCAVPAGAADLNFPSIQGFNDKTAVVMSSGKGNLSRLYKTTDGCQSWKNVLDNPEPTGSFESLRRATAFDMYLLGNPVNGKFVMFTSNNAGDTWSRSDDPGLAAPKGAPAFVAGNEALTNILSVIAFGTGGQDASVYTFTPVCKADKCSLSWVGKVTPLAEAGSTSGVLSIAGRTTMVRSTAPVTGIGTAPVTSMVAVGGDSAKLGDNHAAAAFSADSGATWKLASAQPGGYRSAVDFDGDRDRFIAVGPNGTDASVDDGLIWQALKPGPGDAPEADQHWTALSLPFVVGPHGRIGRLDAPKAKQVKDDERAPPTPANTAD